MSQPALPGHDPNRPEPRERRWWISGGAEMSLILAVLFVVIGLFLVYFTSR